MEYTELFSAIDEHQSQYQNGTITVSDDIEFSTPQLVKQITHYILSRYLDGGNDNIDHVTGLRRPFRNIGNAIVDLEWRAKNIDRKSIEAHATDEDHVFSLLVNKELQLWMKNNNFGSTIDNYQRKKSEYGSVFLKKTETRDELIIDTIQWENISADQQDIGDGMKVEESEFTLLNLKKKRGLWNADEIDNAIAEAQQRKETHVCVLDVEGEFERSYLDDEDESEAIALYNCIVGVVGDKKFLFYKTELDDSRYKYDRRKVVENRDFGVGVWEEVLEPQIWTNEAVIAEKEAMDLGGKVVVRSNKKGLPSALSLMNGEIIDLEADEYFEPISLAPKTLPQFQNMIDAWFINTQRDQSAYPGVTGEEPKASTPFQSLALQAAQGGSIFNKRRDQDGYFILEVLVDWVLPFVIKKVNREHKLTASYSPTELQLIDQGIRNFMLGEAQKADALAGNLITPDMEAAYHHLIDQHLGRQGNKRTLNIPKGYFTLDRIKQKVRFDITNEMSDDQRRLNALATALGQLAPGDPARGPLVAEMMEISGVSAASFPISSSSPAAPTPKVATSRVQEVLPAGQKS